MTSGDPDVMVMNHSRHMALNLTDCLTVGLHSPGYLRLWKVS